MIWIEIILSLSIKEHNMKFSPLGCGVVYEIISGYGRMPKVKYITYTAIGTKIVRVNEMDKDMEYINHLEISIPEFDNIFGPINTRVYYNSIEDRDKRVYEKILKMRKAEFDSYDFISITTPTDKILENTRYYVEGSKDPRIKVKDIILIQRGFLLVTRFSGGFSEPITESGIKDLEDNLKIRVGLTAEDKIYSIISGVR
jgi:hypothetical protein